MTKRTVMITIESSCLQLGDPILEDMEETEEPTFEPISDGELPEPTELLVEGKLVTNERRVELVYEESALSGMEGSITTIGFDRSAPGLLTMMRTGMVKSAFVFEHGKRHTSIYDTPFSSFELCVHTLCVENKLLTEGTIYLDYLVSFHGVESERCRLNISVRPEEELGFNQ